MTQSQVLVKQHKMLTSHQQRAQTKQKIKQMKRTRSCIILTPSWRFVGGGATNSARKRHVRQIMHIAEAHPTEATSSLSEISFSSKISEGVAPHEDDPMVVTVHI